MAKTSTQLKNLRINKAIDRIEKKLSNNASYLDIVKEQLEKKRNKALLRMKSKHQAILLPLENETIDAQTYLEIYAKDEIERLEKKHAWQKRAIRHRLSVRLSKADPSKKDVLNQAYATKMEQLETSYEVKRQSIIDQHTVAPRSKETLEAKKKIYLAEKEDLEKALKAYGTSLIEKDEKILIDTKEKLAKERNKLETSLNTLKATKASLLASFEQYELPEDVILRLDNLRMTFGGLIAVSDLSFDVKKGEIFGLIGPNGAGKTTVFNCITQFYKPTQGNIYYRDKNSDIVNLNHYVVHDIINHGIVRTFQNVELIWELSILDNLLVGAHSLYQTGFFEHLFHSSRFKREEDILRNKALGILSDLGLIQYKDFYPLGLPYGILKQIELARTLMTQPKLIILDEPAAGLNDQETDKLVETIRTIQKNYDCTIFLVEHDMGLVMEVCDTICAISFGKKLAIGTPKEIKANKIVQEAYLGGE